MFVPCSRAVRPAALPLECADVRDRDAIPVPVLRDLDHIKQAFALLAPGGQLVAVCANGPRQGEELGEVCSQWGDLPEPAEVRLQDAAGGVAVRVRIADDRGVAQMSDRPADKYRGYFVQRVDELKDRLE